MRRYEVEYCVHVDHPELRDSSYLRRDEHKSASKRWFDTRAGALNFFNGALKGFEDCGSEYLCWIQVHTLEDGKLGRCIRKRVDRERPARWVFDHHPLPAPARGWSLRDGSPFAYCKECGLTLHEGFPCKHVDQADLDAWLALGRAA